MTTFDMSGFDIPTYWNKNNAWIKASSAIILGAISTKQWEVAIVTGVSTLFKIACDVAHYGFKENPQ